MPEEVKQLIKKHSPLMEESSDVFRELERFFGGKAKIEVHLGDLPKFLGRKRLYRVIRLSGKNFKECVYQLVDDYPESMDALGMLRYYNVPANFYRWEEIENAEIAMGKELTSNAYGWMPDAWTVMESAEGESPKDSENPCEMVAILAFDYDPI